jgi:predicted PurR-regulated permease PerM
MPQQVEISLMTIMRVVGVGLVLWLIYSTRMVWVWMFVAFIGMSAIKPVVDLMMRHGASRLLAIGMTVVPILILVGVILGFGISPLAGQLLNLSERLSQELGEFAPGIPGLVDANYLQQELAGIPREIGLFIFTLFEQVLGVLTIIFFLLYLLVEEQQWKKALDLLDRRKLKLRKLVEKIENRLGSWFRGQILVALIVGSLYLLVLTGLGVEFALPLALLGAMLEFIPILGPVIAVVPAAAVAFMISPTTAVLVLLAYAIIQQLESNVILPQLMKRAVGINSFLILVAVVVGGKLAGVAGVLLAVPTTVVITITLEEIAQKPEVVKKVRAMVTGK